ERTGDFARIDADEDSAVNSSANNTVVEDSDSSTEKQRSENSADRQYDIVVANILADVIMPLSAVVRPYMKKDGLFITSGIIDTKEEEVKAELLKNGFDIVDIIHMGEWVSIVCR
nr:50S ribosomal protein L11 methyltransferase [Eubacterium sp.]